MIAKRSGDILSVFACVFALAGSSVSSSHAQSGVLQGQVTDARNGQPLGNVHITVAGLLATTNATGNYSVSGVPVGLVVADFVGAPTQGAPPLRVQFVDQSIEGTQRVSATAQGFLPYKNNNVKITSGATTILNFSMTPAIAQDGLRLVLNWGATPRDLDSHLKTPIIGQVPYEIYWNNPGSATSVPFDTLDHDVTTGFGPETITMYRFYPGTYHYFVHNFSGENTIAQSGASVQIYTNSGLQQTVFIPSAGTGNYWHVCDINGETRAITIVNQVVSQPPVVSLADYSRDAKKFSSETLMDRMQSPDTIQSWSWNFGDGNTSTLQNPAHTFTANGLYNVSLTVSTGSAQATETRSGYVAVGPVVQVQLRGDSLENETQTVVALPPAGFQPISAWLYYREGGATPYDSVALDTTRLPYEAAIPPSSVTSRGVQYFVVLTGILPGVGQVRITHPQNAPEINPLELRVRSASLVSESSLQARIYKMISVPVELDNPSIQTVLMDDFGEYDPNRWRLFRWKKGAYVEFPELADHFSGGNAFWLVRDSESGFDVDFARSTRTTVSASIVLDTGWNQIGNPFAFPVGWQDVFKDGNVRGPYFYNGTDYTLDTNASLQPWEGYFVLNEDAFPVFLSVPPREAGTSPSSHDDSNENYSLSLSAEITGTRMRDGQNVVGFSFSALDGDDGFDYPEPPPVGEGIQLSIVDRGRRYMRNFKSVRDGEGQFWQVEVRTSLPGQHATVQLSEEGSKPNGYQLVILDEDEFTPVHVQGNTFALQFGAAGEVKHLKLIIGTPEYAAQVSGGIPLVPMQFLLEQNYPNPFNPVTTIRYQLGRRSDVLLDVYDMLGRHVKTLVHESQVTGSYSVTWRGDDARGVSAASGVYVYRLRAGDFSASRKLLLVR